MMLGTQDKPFFPQDIKEKLLFLRSAGFECFEIDGKLLLEQKEAVLQAVRETGFPVCSGCNGYGGWIGDLDEARRQQGLADLEKILCALRDVGADGMVVPAAYGMATRRLPGRQPARTPEEDRKVLLDSLSRLNGVAEKLGLYIFLEPLNSFADHMINKAATAVSLIEEGGFGHVRITCDFYHMALEEDDISAVFRKYAPYIGRVHLSENHRYQPGTGFLDFKKHFETLREVGYQGPAIIESMVRVNEGDRDELDAYLKSVAYLKPIL